MQLTFKRRETKWKSSRAKANNTKYKVDRWEDNNMMPKYVSLRRSVKIKIGVAGKVADRIIWVCPEMW